MFKTTIVTKNDLEGSLYTEEGLVISALNAELQHAIINSKIIAISEVDFGSEQQDEENLFINKLLNK